AMRMQMPDTMHKHASDTAKAQRHDTAHMAMPDSAHAKHDTTHMRDMTHTQTKDTSHMQMRDTAHMQMKDTMAMQHHDTMSMARDTMSMAHDTMPMAISMEGPLGICMERMGSGTTWIPDAVMLPSRHWMAGGWMLMLHGFTFGQYDGQGGPRGGNQLGSLNWGMIMAGRAVRGGQLQFRFMPSLDAATVGKCGYPLLLQSGEVCNGAPRVDRPHPPDFCSARGALY